MKIKFEYMQTPLYRQTFRNKKIKKWVEDNCEGLTLNLFAGETKLKKVKEVRNDIERSCPAEFHMDAFEFILLYKKMIKLGRKKKFKTVILDPPYSERKSMEMYNGQIVSKFNKIKNELINVLEDNGKIITFGYHTNVMGKGRGFEKEKILIMSHGGAIHDTIVAIERKVK